jgi:hypothetical protein
MGQDFTFIEKTDNKLTIGELVLSSLIQVVLDLWLATKLFVYELSSRVR